ncbi:MAG TPA: hypothetical protein VMV77_15455 [Bacteroidales bacterium]|nr:hypothetical protein [Bacteroidales bacterium]
MVCSIDLKDISNERPVSNQLLVSILTYMNSESFHPQVAVDILKVKGIVD